MQKRKIKRLAINEICVNEVGKEPSNLFDFLTAYDSDVNSSQQIKISIVTQISGKTRK